MTTAAASRTSASPKVAAEIFRLAVDAIHPDPDQPRLEVDDELAASILEHGFLESKPIEVRVHPTVVDAFMILDGERRWRGAKKAGLATLYATITTDPDLFISPATRLVRQIVHNQGKPLTPLEEALAFKQIVGDRRAEGDKAYGPVQLARELGIAKSTVSDRLTMASLPAFWLDLIRKGTLQPSHAPVIARWRDVPEDLQQRALGKIREEWQWTKASRDKRPLEIEELDRMLWTHMKQYIKPLSEVGASYTGPVAELRDASIYSNGQRRKYAMDPKLWQPIVNLRKREERAREAKKAASTKGKSAGAKAKENAVTIPRWVQALIERGATRKTAEGYTYNFDGEVLKVENSRHQWAWNHRHGEVGFFDPATLMARLDPKNVTVWVPKAGRSYYSSKVIHICCRDTSALGAARSTFQKAEAEAFERIKAAVAAKLGKHKAIVTGAGAQYLLALLLERDDHYSRPVSRLFLDVGAALDFKGFDKLTPAGVAKAVKAMSAAEAAQLATAIAGLMALHVGSPATQLEAWRKKETDRYQAIHPKDWPALGKDVAAKGDEEVEDTDAESGEPEDAEGDE